MQPGSRVGQFELLEVIGRGGMGEVWRAHDTRLERDVALKTLPARLAADAGSLARLTREAKLLAALNHPNIAAILGIEEQDGSCWLVLELVDGVTLEEYLGARSLALREAADIALQVADALQAAHSRGIVHCDLKPSNIKISADGRVKVLDFGIARSLQAPAQAAQTTQTVLPASGEIAGTPLYMSPEQARGGEVGATSDIWAFGVLLYRMLAGRLPFAGPTVADAVAQVLQSTPDLSRLRPHVPEPMVRLVGRCLEKEPRKRIQHAGDLRVLIEEALHFDPASATGTRTSLAGTPTSPRAWLPIAIIGVAAALAGLAWYFHERTGSGAPVSAQIAPTDASIAVLPFVNMSADPEQEYFSDGLSEELINQLAHIEGLRVTARTSAFSFKGKAEDVRSVGRQLGVAHILEGSVRKSGERLRITAQLINVATGYHDWSETFDRPANDVFAIQDEIATTVAARLGPTLGVAPSTKDYGGTRSAEAYDHLLKGLSAFGGFTRDSILAAIAEYRAALSIDPTYARAAAELAIAMGAASAAGVAITHGEREEITAVANRLAPDAPLTHVANMWLQSDRHEWIEADDSCNAVFKAGHDPRAEWICAGYLTLTGRVRAARPYREAARKDDPLSIVVATTLVRQYAILGMDAQMQQELVHEEQLAGSRRAVGMEVLADLAHKGAPQAAMSEELTRACPGLSKSACDIWKTAIDAPQRAASQLRSQLREITRSLPVEAGTIALGAAYAGDTSLALDALEVFTARAGTPTFQILWYPLLGNVRRDARFKRLMLNLGFVDLWRHTGRWADFCRPTAPDDFECS